MMLEFQLPEIGENITSGQVVKVRVSPGETVKKDQTLIELETEKATIDVPSPADGRIAEVLVKEGDVIQVGQVIVQINGQEQAPHHPSPAPAEPAEAEPPKEDARAKSGQPAKDNAAADAVPPPAPSAQITASFSDVNASPSVRRLSRELGADLHHITGSGPAGAITEDDVKSYVKHILTAADPAAHPPSTSEPLPDFSKWGEVVREPMNAIRKKTASHLSLAWSVIPHVTQFGKADISALEDLRKKYSTPENKLTITPFILKVIAAALRQFPRINASLDAGKQEIIYKKYVHIGVAVDTDKGLVVPVIRDVDRKSILTLAQELKDTAERARAGKLGLDEMKGGCFTLTNLGGLGADYFTPIVNWPEAAILGICRARFEPCFDQTVCAPRFVLPLTLSYDHRIIDGADGARFMKWVCDAIENPFLLEMN